MRRFIKKYRAKKIVFIALYAFVGLAFAGVLFFLYLRANLPSVDQIASREVSQSTKIYDRTGTVLLYEISGGEQRTVVPFDQIPQSLKDATIAIEDQNFYNEPAFDWLAILRALATDALHGKIVQGGSTITQQLAKNAFLNPDRTVIRKAKELILAIELDRHYSKDQILGLYLNEVPYGATIYGVEAASEGYFGKPVTQLNIAESAILASIPRNPPYYSPWGNHTKDLMNRKQLVLQKMLDLKKITKKEFDAAMSYKPAFLPQGRGIKAPHFVMAVQDYLIQKYGPDLVTRGGLKVITTLNWDMQQAAEKAVLDGATQNEKLYGGKNAALVAEDPTTGQILALVGSRDYFDIKNEGNFSVATQGLRQPGSSLKPFVYLTAFQKGYTPDTVLFDVPTEFAANNPSCPPIPDFSNDDKQCFHPEDFEGYFVGPVTMRTALAQSINIPAVKTLYLAGLKNSVTNAYNFGLTSLTSPDVYGLSLVLGGGAVRLIDLAEAYSVLAADGVKHNQSEVLEVRNANGTVLESWKDNTAVVADAESVRVINNILSDAQARSGLFQNSLNLTVFPGYDVALKTGTSNDYHDAWTSGYTPSLVVSVWAGNNDNKPLQRSGSSILAAVPIWHDFMSKVIQNFPATTFTRPDPLSAQKPILAGDYLHNKEIHTILYYVDKSDPAGPQPANPTDDPQFVNWEAGVLSWARQNLPGFGEYNQAFVAGTQTSAPSGSEAPLPPPQIKIQFPAAGAFFKSTFQIYATVSGESPVTKIRVFWNNASVQEFSLPVPQKSYSYEWQFSPQTTSPQNLLEVEAVDQKGSSGKAGVIVYSQ